MDFDSIQSTLPGYDKSSIHAVVWPAANTLTHSAEWNALIEATEWGHEVIVGPAAGPFVDKRIDWPSMTTYNVDGRWTRHAGRFFVVLNHFQYVDKPGTACRQGNSVNPTVLNFDLLFENACCNNRQPPHNIECQDKCYQGGGPVVLDWIDKDQQRGKAPIGLVITEPV